MSTSMRNAIRILRDEHRSISAVLQCLQQLTRMAQDPAVKPDFAVFRAMIHYIDAFPERLHHPKEDDYLFARLLARSPAARPLVEKLTAEHVQGARLVRELESAVLGNEDATATAPGEIVPGREFYDYRAKYLEDTSRLLLPAPVTAECAAAVRAMAVEAFQCLGCSGLARVDFFLEHGTGKLYVNEINTLPGFTSISMYPRLWAAEGWPPARLVQRLLDLALAAHADRRRNERVLPGAGR